MFSHSLLFTLIFGFINTSNFVGGFSAKQPESRRLFISTVLAPSFLAVSADSANAKGAVAELDDKQKILKGYERLNFLLDNWVAETTVCGKGEDNPYLT